MGMIQKHNSKNLFFLMTQKGDINLGNRPSKNPVNHIRKSFEQDPDIKNENIMILNYKGRIHLTGEVKNLYQAQKAPLVAMVHPNVKEVSSSIVVSSDSYGTFCK